MGKIRVHELAKELGVQSRDIIGLLKTSDGRGITPSSALEEEEERQVRAHFAPKNTGGAQQAKVPSDVPQKQTSDSGSDGAQKASEERQPVRKKKNISVVFNRSSDDRRRPAGGRPNGPSRRPNNASDGGDDASRPRPRKMSRRLMESAKEQEKKAAETQAAEKVPAPTAQETQPVTQPQEQFVQQPQAQAPVRQEEQTRAAAQEKPAAEKKQQRGMQENGPAAQKETAKPDGEAKKAAKETAEMQAAGSEKSTQPEQAQQSAGTRPVVRTNILADLQRQEEERKKAAAARKQQQKARNERSRDNNASAGEGRSRNTDKKDQGQRKDNRQNAGRIDGKSRNQRQDSSRQDSSRQDGARSNTARQGGKSAVFNSDAPAKGGTRKGQDTGKKQQQQGDYKKDKRRGSRLDKSEKTFSLEKQSSHKKQHKTPQHTNEAGEEIRTITIPDSLTLKELADILKIAPNALVKKLLLAGKMMTLNQELSFEEAEEIALEYNCIAEHEEKVDLIEELLREEEENEEDLVTRPPVVCVMGHVDHGKTSLLDAIRHTHHIDTEAGGITQAIGAYVVDVGDRRITFLDTPGHEAFTAMRMRGANSTDIAVLVVAADDGVMPQTVEAINHARAAGIDIIVAINKIDKPGADIDRVKQELTNYQLIPEDWGGDTVFCNISAKTGEGIDELLEMILLSADVLELKANPNRSARGLVIESRLDKGKGVVATLLVQKGTLKVGQPVAAGESYGRVRAMTDEDGHSIKSAGPSVPVEIQGLSTVPNAGEIFVALESEKEARAFAETFISEGRNKLLAETKSRMSLDDLFEQIQAGNVKELNIIIKADVQGSAEAIRQSLQKLSNDEVVVKIIHSGVGAISESDVVLATASNALIIGFNVAPDASAKSTAESEGVEIKLYSVIYNAIDDVERAMKGMLDPIYEEQITGHAQIRQIFKASGVGNIAGSYVLDGVVRRDSKVRIIRDEETVFEGELASLKRFKDDVKEAKAGFECGIVISGFDQIAQDDIIEAYMMVEVPRS